MVSLGLDHPAPQRTASALLSRLCQDLLGQNATSLPSAIGAWFASEAGLEVVRALLGAATRTGAANLVPRLVMALVQSIAVARRAGSLDAPRFGYSFYCFVHIIVTLIGVCY